MNTDVIYLSVPICVHPWLLQYEEEESHSRTRMNTDLHGSPTRTAIQMSFPLPPQYLKGRHSLGMVQLSTVALTGTQDGCPHNHRRIRVGIVGATVSVARQSRSGLDRSSERSWGVPELGRRPAGRSIQHIVIPGTSQ